jgi:hypothetical protein
MGPETCRLQIRRNRRSERRFLVSLNKELVIGIVIGAVGYHLYTMKVASK